MRVRIYLDQDLAESAQRLADNQGVSLVEVLNAALREGIDLLTSSAHHSKPCHTQSVNLGVCRFTDVDNIEEILSLTESVPFK